MKCNDEIRQANRKALPKFILLVALGAAVGGVLGYLAAEHGLEGLSGILRRAGLAFGQWAAPWLLLALAVAVPAAGVPLYRRARALLAGWDGEEEALSDRIEWKLSLALWLGGGALILALFLLTAAYSGGFVMLESPGGAGRFLLSIGAFLAVLAETVLLQQKCVDAAKRMNPEKTASVYDMKFQRKWVESCDEAEKLLMGRCAFRAFRVTNGVCTALALVLAVAALALGTGILPSLVVCLIWLVNLCVYCGESLRLSRSGVRIS